MFPILNLASCGMWDLAPAPTTKGGSCASGIGRGDLNHWTWEVTHVLL